MQRRLIPLKRDHDTPLLGSSTCFDGSSRGGSDGPLLPSASRINPHKPSRSPALPLCMAGTEGGPVGRYPVWQASRVFRGWKAVRYARQARVGRHDPETDFGMIPLPTPHHHQTGSATRSRGCHAIAQKGVAKAFCCAGGMMTADGGGGRGSCGEWPAHPEMPRSGDCLQPHHHPSCRSHRANGARREPATGHFHLVLAHRQHAPMTHSFARRTPSSSHCTDTALAYGHRIGSNHNEDWYAACESTPPSHFNSHNSEFYLVTSTREQNSTAPSWGRGTAGRGGGGGGWAPGGRGEGTGHAARTGQRVPEGEERGQAMPR